MKIEIKSRWDSSVLFSIETDSLKLAVEAAVKSRAYLYGADLSRADLSRAYLSRAYLSRADLSRAYLYGADLSRANLYRADLYGFFSFGPGGSRTSYTWSRWEEHGYMVHCGCQILELEDFEKAVKEKHGNSYHSKWYLANIAMMKLIAKESKADFEKALKEKKEKDTVKA